MSAHVRRARSLGAAVVAAVAAWSLFEWTRHDFAIERAIAVGSATGYGAVASLAAALLATPASRMIARFSTTPPSTGTVSAYRRALGTSAAWLALAHAALMLSSYLDGALFALVRPYLRAGAAATVILAALLVTSFPPLVRLLRVRLWKELHRFAYVAALFVLQHLALAPFAPKREVFVGAAVFAICWATRFAPIRRRR